MKKSIGVKILIPFFILAVVCGVCSGIIYSRISQMSKVTGRISDNYLTILEKTDEIDTDFVTLKYRIVTYATSMDDEEIKKIKADIESIQNNISASFIYCNN